MQDAAGSIGFQTGALDSVEVVASVVDGDYYECPDLATLDGHLANLQRNYLGADSNTTDERKAKARVDIDRLLERRLFLQITEAA